MNRVASIKPKGRKGARATVAFEGDARPAIELAVEVIADARLRRGDELDDDAIARLLDADRRARCLEKAWALVALRPRSRREIETALRQRKFPAADIEHACARLAAAGHLDDAAFARHFAEQRAARRSGPRLVRQELRARGVADDVASSSVEPLADAAAQRDAVQKLLEGWKRRTARKDTEPRKRAQAAAAFLLRKGFDPEIVWDCVREGLAEHSPDFSDEDLAP